MPIFECKGIDRSGRQVTIEREFTDEGSARQAFQSGVIDLDTGLPIEFREIISVGKVDLAAREMARKQREQQEADRAASLAAQSERNLGLRTSGDLRLQDTLSAFIGSAIGINALNPSKVETAILQDLQPDHFTVETQGIEISIPYSQIIKIFRSREGRVNTGIFGSSHALVIQVFDLVIYKGAIGFGMSIPMPDF